MYHTLIGEDTLEKMKDNEEKQREQRRVVLVALWERRPEGVRERASWTL